MLSYNAASSTLQETDLASNLNYGIMHTTIMTWLMHYLFGK